MNTNSAEGKFDQLKGKVKQSVGEAFGDESLANSGAADQVKGAAKEVYGNAKDAANTVADDARHDAQDHGHDVRSKITSTAQNVKDSINSKVEEIKEDHRRSA